MPDDTPDLNKERLRRQPPIPLTFAVFLAAIVAFMVVVTGIFTVLRFIGGAR